MKKTFSLLLSIVMLLSLGTTTFAMETEHASITQKSNGDFCVEGVEVIVSYETDDVFQTPTTSMDNANLQAQVTRRVTQDLGTNGYVTLDWTVSSESSIRSAYNYKTNSEKMVVKLKAAAQSTSVTLKCYNINGTEVFSQTATVGTVFNTTFTISGLSYSNTYYFKLFNNDQHQETFSGKISA